mmetsp:Transcript_16083/g.24245  ORF Transcript_16083/g.24245 Transcript_16083/m.24245 type:complete len:544 (-) Transcript_16083:136-1767(-)
MATIVSCSPGVLDCEYDNTQDTCAPYNERYDEPNELTWVVPMAAIFMCLNAFGIGANDVANAWGTSVGSGAIGIRKACLIAGFANILGAVTLGYGVSDTIQKGVAKITEKDCWACGYCDSIMTIYAVGMFSALIGSSAFNMVATLVSAPVSGTHAIVGGVVGMTIAATSGSCVDWTFAGLGGIILSWVLSPIVAGIIGAGLFVFTDNIIMKAERPRERSLMFMPWFVAGSTFIIVFLVLLKSKVTKKAMPIYAHFFVALTAGGLAYFAGWWFRNRYINGNLPSQNPEVQMTAVKDAKKNDKEVKLMDDASVNQLPSASITENVQAEEEVGAGPKEDTVVDPETLETPSTAQNGENGQAKVEVQPEDLKMTTDQQDAVYVFRYLIVFNAALESFAHGSNDTGNSTAPFSAVFQTHKNGLHHCSKPETPEWVLFVAGCCVALGVNSLGYRVMRTVGSKITIINFHRGFCMEFASTAAVVIATLMGMPVSTTHCQIGAVVAVGVVALGRDRVDFRVIGQIVLSWIITLPFAGLTAAAFLAMIRSGL